MDRLTLEFYGVAVDIALPSWLKEELSKDFSFFLKTPISDKPSLTLVIADQEPPLSRIPEVMASLYQPDSISYDQKGKRYVDYFGKALSVYDYKAESGELFSADLKLLHELAYLMILSRVGEMLDKKGMHRVHACGFSIEKKGAVCLLPQGGGKTTLYMELLKNKSVKLVSDDTPLISSDSRLLPFPSRIGVGDGKGFDIPPQFLGSLDRRKYGRKLLIDTQYFIGRISSPVELGFIFKGVREYSNNPRVVEAGKITVFIALLRDCVIGLGLPQMVEYFLRFDTADIFGKAWIVASRVMVCARAVKKAKTYKFIIGKDPQKNAETLLSFIDSNMI